MPQDPQRERRRGRDAALRGGRLGVQRSDASDEHRTDPALRPDSRFYALRSLGQESHSLVCCWQRVETARLAPGSRTSEGTHGRQGAPFDPKQRGWCAEDLRQRCAAGEQTEETTDPTVPWLGAARTRPEPAESERGTQGPGGWGLGDGHGHWVSFSEGRQAVSVTEEIVAQPVGSGNLWTGTFAGGRGGVCPVPR